MTRSELAEVMTARFPLLTKQDVDASVRLIIEAMIYTLVRGQRIEIRGFGSFSLSFRPARIGRNPKTGARAAVPAKWAPHFRPARDMRQRIDASVNRSSTPLRLNAA